MSDEKKPRITTELDVKIDAELWNQVAKAVDKVVETKPSVGDVYSVAATLLHVAASTWAAIIPSEAARQAGVTFDEEAFANLARGVWRQRKLPTQN